MCTYCPNYNHFIKESKNAIDGNDLPALLDYLERLQGEYQDWQHAADTIIDLLLYTRHSNSPKEFVDAVISAYQSQSNPPIEPATNIILLPTKL